MVVLYDGRRRQRGDYLHTPRLQKEPAEPQSCFFFKYILYVYMYVVIYIYIRVCVLLQLCSRVWQDFQNRHHKKTDLCKGTNMDLSSQTWD